MHNVPLTALQPYPLNHRNILAYQTPFSLKPPLPTSPAMADLSPDRRLSPRNFNMYNTKYFFYLNINNIKFNSKINSIIYCK